MLVKNIGKITSYGLCFLVVFIMILGVSCAPRNLVRVPGYPSSPTQGTQKLSLVGIALKLKNAEELCYQKKYAQCARIYEQLLRKNPNNGELTPLLLSRLQKVYLEMGDFEKSEKYGNELISEYPNYPGIAGIHVYLIEAYLGRGDLTRALEDGQRLWPYIRNQEDKARLAYLLSKVFTKRKEPLNAIYWLVESERLAVNSELKNNIYQQITKVVSELSKEQVLSLLSEFKGRFPELWLETRLVGIMIDDGKLDEAAEKLNYLTKTYPLHPLSGKFNELREVIDEQRNVDATAIGCLLPLNGPLQPYGRRLLRGLYLAQELYNLSTWGKPIKIIVKDSSDKNRISETVDELVNDHHVLAIIGPLSRKVVDEAASEAQRLRVPIITLSQKRSVVDIGNYVFRVFLTNRDQARLLVAYAVRELDLHKFAILYPKDNYGRFFEKVFSEELNKLPVSLIAKVGYDPQTTDFTQPIRELFVKAGIPLPTQPTQHGKKKSISILSPPAFDAIFLPDQVQTASLIASQLVYNDVIGVRLFGTNLWNTPSLEKEYAPYLEGAIFVGGFFADSPRREVRQFVERFEANYDEKPQYLEAQAYDVLNLLLAAKNNIENQSRGAIRSELIRMKSFEGITGKMSILPSGDEKKELFLLTVKNGRISAIKADRDRLY